MTRDEILNSFAHFTWTFGMKFHVSINSKSNYEWSDPDYGGDNSFTPCPPWNEYSDKGRKIAGRDKGRRRISDYCGDEIIIRGQ